MNLKNGNLNLIYLEIIKKLVDLSKYPLGQKSTGSGRINIFSDRVKTIYFKQLLNWSYANEG